MARKSTPYVMRPRGHIPPRATITDAPDPRVPPVRPAPVAVKTVRGKLREGPVDPHLRGVDRCLDRWSWTVPGTRVQEPALAQARILSGQSSRPSALADHDWEIVTQAVKTSPPWVRQLVQLWYKTEQSASEIAGILGSTRRQTAYERLNLALAYLLGRLSQMGLRGVTVDPFT